MRRIDFNEFLDKVHGCWYGKCLGGAAGAPVEGIKKIIDVNDFREIFNPDLPNDDLDLQLLWLDVLEQKGTIINSCDLADAWIEKCWYPFSEYGYFMKNYMRGIKPPYSGIINNSFFKEGMGCPIRSEIWGIISVGNPKLASEYAYMDATLDHSDNSVYAEQFLAVVESMAFFECDIKKLIDIGLSYIPNNSKLYDCIKKVIELYDSRKDWTFVRNAMLNEFGHPDFTNVVQNMGIVMIALLYGECDMEKTINIALKCGYDTDCTCASAAAIIGIIKGYSRLGELTSLIKDYFVCGIAVKRQSDSIKMLALDSCKVALLTPNYEVEIEGQNRPKNFSGFLLDYATEQGLNTALHNINPLKWDIYGPFYEQLEQEIDQRFPSPHGEGCVLPDIVCMVNNQVFLDKEYDPDFNNPTLSINAYEDLIEIDQYLTIQGQICVYAKTVITVPNDIKLWAIIGNNDGFILSLNGKEIIKKDEIRLWTPYNNFTELDLKKGENEIILKLLRRTENLKFALGFRIHDGNHWHKSKWHTDLF